MTRIQDIRIKAQTSEKMVQDVTRDIKSLDYAKTHLTQSINTLNHMHMLVGGVETLKEMSGRRQYRDAANLLEAISNIIMEFERFSNIPKVRTIMDDVRELKLELRGQIKQDFEDSFTGKQYSGPVEHLREACQVLEVLGPESKKEMIDWFVRKQMADYYTVFPDGEEVSGLDKVDRRYSWAKRIVSDYEECCTGVFPASWRMNEAIFYEFCLTWRKNLVSLLAKNKTTLNVELLLSLLQKTVAFEKYLTSRFWVPTGPLVVSPNEAAGDDHGDGDNLSLDGTHSGLSAVGSGLLPSGPQLRRKDKKKEPKTSKFTRLISSVFEGYMSIYIDAQDRHLNDTINEAVVSARQAHKAIIEDDTVDVTTSGIAKVLASSSDLFFFYKNCMVQCSSMTTKQPLFQIYKLFAKYLTLYASKVLTRTLPKASLLSSVAVDQRVQQETLTPQEIYVVCSILNTAEYCSDTTAQLATKLKEKIDVEYQDKVELLEQQDGFHEVVSSGISLLVRSLEVTCDDVCNRIVTYNWGEHTTVGDTSPYVSVLAQALNNAIPVIRNGVETKYFNNFCMKLVSSFLPRYSASLYKAHNVCTVAAEQLLLDAHAIKELLSNMHSLDSETAVNKPASYTKMVLKNMTKVEMSLKVVMTPTTPNDMFVQTYLALLPDDDQSTFQRIVLMKSLKKQDEQALLAAYTKAANGSSISTKGDGMKVESDGNPSVSVSAPDESTRMKKIEDFITRFK
ncbi:hypothetical protein SARC_01164 [Sphaeroforma arctica JP610]|uniref:Vps53 N-terminal domain-containing protein n=1 Tax=Sphaeroforma arctica JP610 TaxID=667725 RepID=A0A0L0GCG1_9EUKA|nr:hypothetical protein SARC_01164 [Sphaeroforma arctica JP610]KNC86697.1 hypothetical protein SARC_01164 [Sphaeroforma arctica JP610]|eukprot:XP_014160599.1 hypothetical protein SARC_01164 [Sphaeroforma arctica JP610]